MNTGGGFFRNTLPFGDDVVPAGGVFLMNVLEEVLDDLFLLAAGLGVHPVRTVLQFVALVDEQGGVAAVVNDQLRSLVVWEAERLVGAPPVFLQRFAFPGEDG